MLFTRWFIHEWMCIPSCVGRLCVTLVDGRITLGIGAQHGTGLQWNPTKGYLVENKSVFKRCCVGVASFPWISFLFLFCLQILIQTSAWWLELPPWIQWCLASVWCPPPSPRMCHLLRRSSTARAAPCFLPTPVSHNIMLIMYCEPTHCRQTTNHPGVWVTCCFKSFKPHLRTFPQQMESLSCHEKDLFALRSVGSQVISSMYFTDKWFFFFFSLFPKVTFLNFACFQHSILRYPLYYNNKQLFSVLISLWIIFPINQSVVWSIKCQKMVKKDDRHVQSLKWRPQMSCFVHNPKIFRYSEE